MKKAIFGLIFVSLLISACGSGPAANEPGITVVQDPNVPTVQPTATRVVSEAESSEAVESASGYPAPEEAIAENGYPSPNQQPSNDLVGPVQEIGGIQVDVPAPASDAASIGGVLVRERIDENTFYPMVPARLLLGEIVNSTEGAPMFLSAGDSSISAEVFDTGAFIFRSIPPGTYGLVVDLAVTTYPVRGDDGTMLLVTVESGDAINLGEVSAEVPSE
ncbi:MAG: hypothetical protein AAF902_10595 [Chloroflexota bacterium]